MMFSQTYMDITNAIKKIELEMHNASTYWYDDFESTVPIPPVTLRKCARKIAKEKNRPFIQASVRYSPITDIKYEHLSYGERPRAFSWASLKVPKRQYLGWLVNPIMLVAKKTAFRREYEGDHPVWDISMEQSSWYFRFNNEDYFRNYMQLAFASPEVRSALRLPEEVTDEMLSNIITVNTTNPRPVTT